VFDKDAAKLDKSKGNPYLEGIMSDIGVGEIYKNPRTDLQLSGYTKLNSNKKLNNLQKKKFRLTPAARKSSSD